MQTLSWKDGIQKLIQERNEVEVNYFRSVAEQYRSLIKEYQTMKQKYSQNQKQYQNLVEQNKVMSEELEILKSDGHSVTVSNAKVKELEDKIFCLQEDLTVAYRNKAETAESMLELNSDIKKLKSQLKDKTKVIEEKDEQISKLEQEIKEVKEGSVRKDATIEMLKKEMEALRREVATRDDKITKLSNENSQFISTMVQQKQQQAEAMNQAMELYKTVELQKKELERLQTKYKEQTSITSTTGKSSQGTMSPMTEELDNSAQELSDSKLLQSLQNVRKSTSLANSSAGSSAFNSFFNALGIGRNSGNAKAIVLEPPQKLLLKKTLDSQFNCLKFSEDGTRIYTGSSDKTVKVFSSKNLELLTTYYGATEAITNVTIQSRLGLVIGASTDSICRVWNTNGSVKHVLTGHEKKIYGCDLNADASKIVTGSYDRTIKLWEIQRGDCIKTIITTCKSSVNDLEVNGTDLICSAHFDNSVRFHDVKTYKLVTEMEKIHSQPLISVNFSKDNMYLLTSSRDNTLKVFDMRTYKELCTLQDEEFKTATNLYFNKAVFSPCGEYVATGSASGSIVMWKWNQSFKPLPYLQQKGHTNSVSSVAWSFDGMSLASVGLDKQICLWG